MEFIFVSLAIIGMGVVLLVFSHTKSGKRFFAEDN